MQTLNKKSACAMMRIRSVFFEANQLHAFCSRLHSALVFMVGCNWAPQITQALHMSWAWKVLAYSAPEVTPHKKTWTIHANLRLRDIALERSSTGRWKPNAKPCQSTEIKH
eukprot:1963293-Amphidinium_carterae.2